MTQAELAEDVRDAETLVNRGIGLAGTCLAIFMFVLFFLYPRYSSGEVNPWLFQASLTAIVLAVFSFILSALYYYGVQGAREDRQRKNWMRRGTVAFLAGIFLVSVMPVLILFTVNVEPAALIALVAEAVFIYEIIRQNREMPWLNQLR